MLWAFDVIEGRAYSAQRPLTDLTAKAEPEWVWMHFRVGDVRARGSLAQIPGLPATFLALIDELESRIQLHDDGAWTYGVLPDLERDLGGKVLGAVRFFFALDSSRLITARLHPLRGVDDVRRQIEQGRRIRSPALAVMAFIEQFIEVLETRLERLADHLDEVEDLVLAESANTGELRLGPFRRELSRHRREFQALRHVMVHACSQRETRRGERLAEHLSPLISPMEDLDREAAGLQDRARLLHEEIDTLINSATNRSMRALTVISTLLIPPTLIVGAFGMNLPGMPFEHSNGGFAAASGLCLATVLAAWAVLRRLRVLP
jgi:zinc transporter